MEPFETQLKTLGKMGREVKLTDSERLSMRSHLETQMRISRVTPAQSSPYFSSFSFTRLAQAAVFMFIGIIVGGGSIGYISASALPGDTLYPVKTDVIEKVKGSFATSPEARLSYQEELMYKRLEEIDTLKKEDRLDEKTSASAKIAIGRQTDNFSAALAIVEEDNSTFAEEKIRTISSELKRREDIFRHKGEEAQGAVMAMRAVSIETTVSPSPIDMIADEMKVRREHFEAKEKAFEKRNREKIEYAEKNLMYGKKPAATGSANASIATEEESENETSEEGFSAGSPEGQTGNIQIDLSLPQVPGL